MHRIRLGVRVVGPRLRRAVSSSVRARLPPLPASYKSSPACAVFQTPQRGSAVVQNRAVAGSFNRLRRARRALTLLAPERDTASATMRTFSQSHDPPSHHHHAACHHHHQLKLNQILIILKKRIQKLFADISKGFDIKYTLYLLCKNTKNSSWIMIDIMISMS